MIATGGTIASKATPQGLAPMLSAGEILACVPGLADICQVESRQLFDLDSTNMRPEQWLEIAACIEEITTASTALSSPTAPIRWPTPPRR